MMSHGTSGTICSSDHPINIQDLLDWVREVALQKERLQLIPKLIILQCCQALPNDNNEDVTPQHATGERFDPRVPSAPRARQTDFTLTADDTNTAILVSTMPKGYAKRLALMALLESKLTADEDTPLLRLDDIIFSVKQELVSNFNQIPRYNREMSKPVFFLT